MYAQAVGRRIGKKKVMRVFYRLLRTERSCWCRKIRGRLKLGVGFLLQWMELASSPSVPSTPDKSLRYRHSPIFRGLHCRTIPLPHSDRDKGTGTKGPPFSWYRQALYLRTRSSSSANVAENSDSSDKLHLSFNWTHVNIKRCEVANLSLRVYPTRGILTNDAFDAWLFQASA